MASSSQFKPLALFCLGCLVVQVRAQLGSPDNSQLYDGPYIQVYPPVDLSQDQQSCFPQNSSNGTCPLYFGLIISFGGDYDSSGSLPGVQIALDQINADPDLLPGYTLHYTLTDSNCSRVTSLEALTAQLFYPPNKISILGSGCSVATEPTAEVSRFYNVTQISHISSSPELSNRNRFRYHFALLSSDVNLAYGFYGIIRRFQWRRVSIIVQDESLFTVAMAQLRSLLSSSNVNSTERRFRSDENITTAIGNFNPEYRIIVLSMFLTRARQILCMAYQQGVRYPQYLFLVYPFHSVIADWWVGTAEEQEELMEMFAGCTASQRESVLPFTLSPLLDEFISDESIIADSGINGSQFLSLYSSYLSQSPLNLTDNIAGQQSYDATWTLARALDIVIRSIRDNTTLQTQLIRYDASFTGGEFGLQHFTYNNSGVLGEIFSNLERSDFAGLTGRVQFDQNGVRRVGRANVFSYQYSGEGGERLLRAGFVGSVNFTDTENVVFSFEDGFSEDVIWSTAGRPYDGQPNIETETVSVVLTVIFSLLATAGIVFAIVCLVFNITFRKKKIIRPSSPNLSNMIAIGAIILYIDVFFFVIPTTNPTAIAVFCNLNPWFTAIGYSLCYGTILMKMFRVYYIINYPTPTKKNVIRDWMLALGVLLLVVIDLIILTTYSAVEGARGELSAQRVPNRENPEDMRGETAVIYKFFIYICDSLSHRVTLGILYGYKALLQLIALILAFSIRKVKFKVLNDSPYIALAIYVTSIVTAVIIVSTYSLRDIINGYAVVFGLGFLIGTSVILLLVFVPNMINLYQDPEGLNIRKMSIQRSPFSTTATVRRDDPYTQTTVTGLGSDHDRHVLDINSTEVSGRRSSIIRSMGNATVENNDYVAAL